MSEQPKQFDVQAWTRMVVGAAVTVITSWQLFTHEIHGYIDEQVKASTESISNSVTDRVSGDMLMKLDLIKDELKTECNCPPKDDQEAPKRKRR